MIPQDRQTFFWLDPRIVMAGLGMWLSHPRPTLKG
jgi:hypothetical protein